MDDHGSLVKAFTGRRIAELMNARNDAAVRAKLAMLRRGIGKAPGAVPELWDVTLADLPEALYSRDGVPTRAEWAAYTALTLFALHQQGSDMKTHPMNREGVSLGAALRRLVRSEEDDARVKRRFDAVVTAESITEFTHHLRGLVQLLKSEDIPLDYPALAVDTYLFQFDGARDRVRLRMGQDFYRRQKENGENQAESAEQETTGKDGSL